MAKISRSPYHGSRYVKRIFNKNTDVRFVHSGDVLFIDVPTGGMNLTYNYNYEGCYNKIIIRESMGDLTISFNSSVSGVIVYDVGGQADVIQAQTPQESSSITVASGATDGSTLDLICDGQRWYIKGLIHGSIVTSS